MQKLSNYRWITLIALAIICQLFCSRAAQSLPVHVLVRADVAAGDQAILPDASRQAIANSENRQSEPIAPAGGSDDVTYRRVRLAFENYALSSSQKLILSRFQQPQDRLWLILQALLL